MDCVYSGSYYDPSPWTEHACFVESSVPAGCAIDVVTAGDPTVTVMGHDSSSVVVDTITKTFTLPDEFSCDCAPTQTAVAFQRIALTVPDAVEGDVLNVMVAGEHYGFVVTAAAPCVTEWPDDYEVALACDRCPDPVGGPTTGDPDPTSPAGGCSTSNAPSLVLALLALIARRGRSRGAAAPR